ncbi:zinc ribbon domain-containing protein [Collinsella tanakaei]|uniref:zinc ribbon domain-containing protein n=1 Tax=Collinsella tanakaei TaxID=626935 RepID=UPI001F3C85B3|nr:zinc ribbon domain-containing protein [Collinsella tanakaei]MCF2621421.1 zinc ribbon domain-containing protein [Collinsella tanakaei]
MRDDMHICSACGSEIDCQAKFCVKCGSPVEITGAGSDSPRETYQGSVVKCPACGEMLGSFTAYCPACGYELRDSERSASLSDFTKALVEVAHSDSSSAAIAISQQVLIKNFVIPNSKGDIFDFMMLAQSNINSALENAKSIDDIRTNRLIDAWLAKGEQAYQKGRLLLSDSDNQKLESLYHSIRDAIDDREKRFQSVAARKAFLRTIGLYVAIVLLTIAAYSAIEGKNSSILQIIAIVILLAAIPASVNRGRSIYGIVCSVALVLTAFALGKMVDYAHANASFIYLGAVVAAIELPWFASQAKRDEKEAEELREERDKIAKAMAEGKIIMPISSGWPDEKDRITVKHRFEEAGFTNVELIPLNDINIITALYVREGIVEDVTVGGKRGFVEGTFYYPTVPIAVYYHSRFQK